MKAILYFFLGFVALYLLDVIALILEPPSCAAYYAIEYPEAQYLWN